MGKLIQGEWQSGSILTSDDKGAYKRVARSFLEPISNDHPQFKPESGRYHLYVSYACPWAHRTLIYRRLKALEPHISVSVVHPDMLENGWTFSKDFEGATGDSLYQHDFLYQVYQQADAHISTTVTVPILWDKSLKTIVNNESSQIIRLFNTAFNDITGNHDDYYPEKDRQAIDALNARIYDTVNNGVYQCGFARTQSSYDHAVTDLFSTLETLEEILSKNRYLLGETLTEADLRLIPTLLRFDPVYVTHFKCNIKRLIDYPNLSRYITTLRKIPAIEETTHMEHIKRHYYYSHKMLNPNQIIPKGPERF